MMWSEGHGSQVEQVTLKERSNFSVYVNVCFTMPGAEGVKENGKSLCCSQDKGLRLQTFHLEAGYLPNVPRFTNLKENSPFALSSDTKQ